MSKWIDPDYRGEEKENIPPVTSDSEDEFVPPMKKMKTGTSGQVSTLSTFGEEDLLFFVSRVSIDMQELVKKTLHSEEGKVMGVLLKLIDNRLGACNRRMCAMNKAKDLEIDSLKGKILEYEEKLDKLNGMTGFTYAWCKKASDAGIFQLPKRY